jgi:hypothetical protein
VFGLKPPHSIFIHASGFQKMASTIILDPDKPNFDPLCSSAVVTNMAFAIELYLKCLIHLETGQLIKSEHNLRKLFARLTKETQKEIEAQFNAGQKSPDYDLSNAPEHIKTMNAKLPKNLQEALKVGGDAFIEWRYLYENADGNPFSLFALPSILNASILKRKPEWRTFRLTKVKVGDVKPTSPVPKTPK